MAAFGAGQQLDRFCSGWKATCRQLWAQNRCGAGGTRGNSPGQTTSPTLARKAPAPPTCMQTNEQLARGETIPAVKPTRTSIAVASQQLQVEEPSTGRRAALPTQSKPIPALRPPPELKALKLRSFPEQANRQKAGPSDLNSWDIRNTGVASHAGGTDPGVDSFKVVVGAGGHRDGYVVKEGMARASTVLDSSGFSLNIRQLQDRLMSGTGAGTSNRRQHIPQPGERQDRNSIMAHALLAQAPGDDVGSVLSLQDLRLREITRLLTRIGQVDCDRALSVFEWLNTHGVQCDVFVYTRLMSMFARSELPHGAVTALGIFSRMQAAGVEPDLVAYNTAIHAAARAGNFEKAQDMMQQLQAGGLQPDVWTYSSLMAACAACSDRWREVLAFLEQMESLGVEPNVVTYTTAISVCQRASQWERAKNIFRRMEAAGVAADVNAYNALMTLYARAGLWEEAWAVLTTMRQAGIVPNTRSYNAAIAACERCCQADRALELFARMERDAAGVGGSRCAPSVVTFNTLISACGKARYLDQARKLLARMHEVALTPDAFTIASFVAAAGEQSCWQEAKSTFDCFVAEGGRPTRIAYNALVSCLTSDSPYALTTLNRQPYWLRALARVGQWQAAMDVLDAMDTSADPSVRPDEISYSAVVAACEMGVQLELVLAVHLRMVAAGLTPPTRTLMAVMRAGEKTGAWELASEAFREVEARRDAAAGRGGLAGVARALVYRMPTPLAAPLMSASLLAVDSGRAARRWMQRNDEPEEG